MCKEDRITRESLLTARDARLVTTITDRNDVWFSATREEGIRQEKYGLIVSFGTVDFSIANELGAHWNRDASRIEEIDVQCY